jgi:hypothetical protein
MIGIVITGLCVWVVALICFRRRTALDEANKVVSTSHAWERHWRDSYNALWEEHAQARRKIKTLETRLADVDYLSTEIQSRTKLAA